MQEREQKRMIVRRDRNELQGRQEGGDASSVKQHEE